MLILLLFALGGVLLVPDLRPSLRWGLLLYAGSSIAIWAVHNPVGGNMGRIGALVGGPLAAYALGTRRRWKTLAVVACPLLAWQIWPAGTALQPLGRRPVEQGRPTTPGSKVFLRTQDVAAGRVEVPALRQHWESYYVPKVFPIARGLGAPDRPAGQRDPLPPRPHRDQLHDWMVRSGVGLVALADAPLDYWSQREAALGRGRATVVAAGLERRALAGLAGHRRPGPGDGPARLTELGIDSFHLDVPQAGPSVVRVRWSAYWQVTSGSACLRPGPDGWITVDASRPGAVSVAARWSLAALVRPSHAPSRCG